MNKAMLSVLLACCASAAWAQSGSVSVTDEHGNVQSTTATATAATSAADASNEASQSASDHYCLHETGSHLRVRSQTTHSRTTQSHDGRDKFDCAGYGRAYSRDELERTGAVNTADALRQLDPSFR